MCTEKFRSKIGNLLFSINSYLPTHKTVNLLLTLCCTLKHSHHFCWLLGYSPTFIKPIPVSQMQPNSGDFLGKLLDPWVTASLPRGSLCPLTAFLCGTTHPCGKLLRLCPLRLHEMWTLYLRKGLSHSFNFLVSSYLNFSLSSFSCFPEFFFHSIF